jgi:hypothetical protein
VPARAEAAALEGDTGHAIALIRRAIDAVDPEVDPGRAGMLYERLGRYLWANGDAESESIGAYERAVQLVPDTASAQRARALTGLASALVYADRPDPSSWCEEAVRWPGRRRPPRGGPGVAVTRVLPRDGRRYRRWTVPLPARARHRGRGGDSEDHCRPTSTWSVCCAWRAR